MTKKILVDARSLGEKPSGIGMYVYYMVKALYEYNDFSLSLVTDVALSEEILELEKCGIPIYRYGKGMKKNFGLFSYYHFVQQCIHEEKPDIFWEANNLVPIKLENPYGKLVASIQDMFPLSHPKHYGMIYPHYFKYGMDKTIDCFDAYIYDSNDTKKEAEKYFPALQGKKSLVSYIIVPRLPKIEEVDNGAFLYVGNLETRKGTDILLNAYREYRRNGGMRTLRLSGKIREEAIRKLLAEVSEAVGGIEYLGYLSEENRNKEYASCHAFIFPSRAEGFGIPVVEVLNYAKPIIATDLDTIHEVVGECIEYISLDDQVVKRLADLMLLDAFVVIREDYEKVIQRYLPEIVGSKMRDYFNEL
ncbi:MAG: glycosyltransferase family 4 protein [Solobacterium sp.]|nr:glycosyltransferase family 4 protein [Solobacterium sp.]